MVAADIWSNSVRTWVGVVTLTTQELTVCFGPVNPLNVLHLQTIISQISLRS